MDLKRGITFIFLLAVVIFSVGILSAKSCTVQAGSCSSGYYPVMKLSGTTNAHGGLTSSSYG